MPAISMLSPGCNSEPAYSCVSKGANGSVTPRQQREEIRIDRRGQRIHRTAGAGNELVRIQVAAAAHVHDGAVLDLHVCAGQGNPLARRRVHEQRGAAGRLVVPVPARDDLAERDRRAVGGNRSDTACGQHE